MTPLPIGKLITDEQFRDAIHIAVCPVEAGERLNPGDHVSITDGKAFADGKFVGIVDPFLTDPVRTKQRFFLFIYPNTITSLRHNWAHSDLPDSTIPVSQDTQNRGVAWLEQYAQEIGASYEELVENAMTFATTGEYWIEGGRWEGQSLPDEFWPNFTIATGKIVEDRGNFFSLLLLTKSTINSSLIQCVGGPLCGHTIQVMDGFIPLLEVNLQISPGPTEILPPNWTELRIMRFWENRFSTACQSAKYALGHDGCYHFQG